MAQIINFSDSLYLGDYLLFVTNIGRRLSAMEFVFSVAIKTSFVHLFVSVDHLIIHVHVTKFAQNCYLNFL